MILSVIVLILVGAIAYFHYVQGFFSATISAILTILAATLAFSFHEVVVRSLLGGKIADQAHALTLVALFVLIYLVFRVIFDKFIPGNIRLPVMADKVGAGVMGLVAAMYAVGILVVAAQTLPFGPSIAGYSRYALIDKQDVQLPTQRQAMDAAAYDVLSNETLDPGKASRLIIPVDDVVVGTTRALSDGGSLAGPQSLSAVHPSYLDEAFTQRLGVQAGAKHVAYNLASDKQIEVRGLSTIDSIPQADGESDFIKDRWVEPLRAERKSDTANILLVARLFFARNASDSDNKIRVSPGAVRLVAKGKNYYPIGTLQLDDGPILRANRTDDFLIVESDGVVDFVFNVPREDVGLEVNKKETFQISPDVFIEAKRLGFCDISGMDVKRTLPETPKTTLMRKKTLPAPKVAPGSSGTAAREMTGGPLEFGRLQVSSELFTDINVSAYEGDSADVTFGSGNANVRQKKFAKLEVNTTDPVSKMRVGDFLIREFWAPPGQKVVRIVGEPGRTVANKWEWAEKLGQFELIDSSNNSYKPRGAWAKVKQGTADKMVAKWDAEAQLDSLPNPGAEARPTDVWIGFVVPENTTIREVRFAGKRLKSVDQVVN